MKSNLPKHWLMTAILGILAPWMLWSAEPTNPIPPVASTQSSNEVGRIRETQPPLPGTPAKTKIIYKLPLRGAPAVRIDGGSRGSGLSLICLTVLAPDHTGLTIHDQPALFWYQSEPADAPFELTVIVEGKPEPILRVKFPNAQKAGIQCVRLSDHNVRLAPGVEYEWVVALIVDGESRSKDVVASGYIKKVEPSAVLSDQLARATREDLPAIYAAEGVWYDAVESLASLIDERPGDQALRVEDAALLNQVGLARAAAFAGEAIRQN